MTNRALPLLAGLLLLLGTAGLPAALHAERYPCGHLLLPYFEVEIPEPGENPFTAPTTLFSVGNCGETSQHVTLTVWTNWAQPVLTTRVEIEALSLVPWNLRDWLIFGNLPDRQLSADELAHVQAALTGRPSPQNGLYYGAAVADRLAVGYVTVEGDWFVRSRDLWGDFFSVDPSEDYAGGESLVRLVGDETREICERHLLRFLESGSPGIATHFVFWTGVGGPPSAVPEARFVPQQAVCHVYSEQGVDLGTYELPLLATQAIAVADLEWPTNFGWIDCVTPTSSFACVHFSAEKRYTMTLRSYCEETENEPEPPENAGVSLEKSTNGFDADRPEGPELVVGTPVIWTYEVVNRGEVALTQISVVDDQEVEVVCPRETLNPGESMICTAEGVAELGQYRNVGTVRAQTPRGVWKHASDPSHYTGEREIEPPRTSVNLEKLTLGWDADEPPGPELTVGDPVAWTYEVTNTGETVLTDIVVSDDQGVAVTCPRVDLGPGESFVCTGSGVAVEGQYANLGTVSAKGPDGETVTASDPSHYLCEPPEPPPEISVDLEKHTLGEDADSPAGPTVMVGDPVTWSYEVTNTGDTPLTDIVVTDDQGVAVSCPKTDLEPGETMVCTGLGLAIEGQYSNLGTVTAHGPAGEVRTASDPSHYYGEEETPECDEGCTPGYWKNHPESWSGYSTGQTVASVFAQASAYPTLGAASLIEALDFGGGPGAEGAASILLRAGVAALLNAMSQDVCYPRTEVEVVAAVDTALASGNRDAMLVLAAELDMLNNLGCPL